MKVISVVNQKGGVGKTTTAFSLGKGLARKGFRVLMIDLDSQGSLSYYMNVTGTEFNSLNVIANPAGIKREIQHLENVDIIASIDILITAETDFQKLDKQLHSALDHVKNDYDYCIIDTPPAIGIILINALVASNYLVITAPTDMFSIQGVTHLKSTIEAVQEKANKNLTVLGILAVRYNQRMLSMQYCLKTLDMIANTMNTCVFDSKIRECNAIRESQILQQDIFSYSPRSNASKDYNNFIDEVIELTGDEN